VPSGVLLVRRVALGTPFDGVVSLARSLADRGGDVLVADDVAVERPGEAESAEAGPPGRVLAGIAGRLRGVAARREARAPAARFEGKRVLFVLPVMDRGGGTNVVFREARAMVEMGVDARVVNLRESESAFRRGYPEPEVPVTFVHPAEIPALGRDFDAVVATANTSVEWLVPLAKDAAPVLGYYVQDFEPYFYPSGSAGYAQALASYTLIPRLVRFAKTEWNAREVEAACGVPCAVVGASFDTSFFGPRQPRMPVPPLRIAAMIRPSSPRRQPELTLRVLEEVWRRHGRGVEIALFGETREVDGRPIRANFPHRHVGMLQAEGLARLFNEIHVFADFSSYQAMGLTALEAMACGAAAIVPKAGGASAFAVDGKNALLVDTASPESGVAALSRLVEDPSLAARLGDQAIADVVAFTPDAAALRILEALFPRA
ncbi:MAG TPA: glycosyltransferase family 4 protein, partial [Thermoanaerobaculia bacterium]|nr:glycosyltransferase family 4 protein [Thermoanaerobaculia bacterium]